MSSIIRPPDFKSKVLSVSAVTLFTFMIVLAAYLPSILKGKINKNIFSISQSLAFGNKPAIISLLTLFYCILSYLIYYRGPKNLTLFIRLFLIFIICSLIITIVWVTTFYDLSDHYIIATVIFICLVINIFLTSFVIYKGLKIKTRIKLFILFFIPLLSILGFIGLIINRLNFVRNKVKELFPSFENFMIFINFLSILTLGFM